MSNRPTSSPPIGPPGGGAHKPWVEPGTDADTTDIYISHRGMVETSVSAISEQTRWTPRPADRELAPEGVYVTQEPNLVLLRDTNGDDKADSMEIVLGGFDTHDTHHLGLSATEAVHAGGHD